MRILSLLISLLLMVGCAGTPDRENSFSSKTGPRCPPGQMAVVERRLKDDRYDCVAEGFFDRSEIVSYDGDF